MLPAHRELETWLERLPDGEADRVLLGEAAIASFNDDAREHRMFRDVLAPRKPDRELIATEIEERRVWLQEQIASGKYVESEPGAFERAASLANAATDTDETRLVVQETQLYCVPLATGLFKPPVDRDFDRNHCASLHPAEPVRVLRSGDDGWLYAESDHTEGWLQRPDLTPPLARREIRELGRRPRLAVLADDTATLGGRRLRMGTTVPLVKRKDQSFVVLVPTAKGLVKDQVGESNAVTAGYATLTRRKLWGAALARLDADYGWGGRNGGRDCSRFVRDLFASFGIQFARHSSSQARQGTAQIDIEGLDEARKRAAIRRAGGVGIVLLYMPGHIMLYLGERDGKMYALSSISEYLEPCPGGPDTVYRPDAVAVTTLELGRDTERTAFIERLTRIVVIGSR